MKLSACVLIALFALATPTRSALAIEPSLLLKETHGSSRAGGPASCPLEPNLTGDCANLSYYNLCSGYIWVYSGLTLAGEAVGTAFVDSCVRPGNSIDKAITYFRATAPGYNQTVDVAIDVDTDANGCPDRVLAIDLNLDPGLRWNCSNFGNVCIPDDAAGLIVRTLHHGGTGPSWATDADPFGECDPDGSDHSYYYGINLSACVPWRFGSPTGRGDNFLYWLIVDSGCLTSTEATSWGAIKGLFR
jgi:hypothetical protein